MTGFRGAAAAEWTKLRSVRSTYLIAVAAVALSVTFGALAARSAVHSWPTMSPHDRAVFDPILTSLDGASWAEFLLPLLGLLAVTSEYGTGMIRTTFLAVPRRRTVLAGKIIVVGGVSLVLGELVVIASLLVGRLMLGARHFVPFALGTQVLRGCLTGGCYLLVLSLVAVAVGALLRHTAAAVTAMIGLLYLAYGFARALESWSHVPDRWLLVNIGGALLRVRSVPDPKLPSFAGAWAELAVYALVAVGLASWRFGQDA